jgi:predicted TPR repeat methyltransferase
MKFDPWRILVAIVVAPAILVKVAAVDDSSDSAEMLFRRVFATYRRKENTDPSRWGPWDEISTMLLLQVDKPLKIIGAFEESILVIEKATVAAGAGEDPERDAALSKLYYGYAKMLASLDADMCTTLALSPYNLMIGAETADADSPSTKLCIENAENSLRNAASLDATNKEVEKLLREILGGASGGIHERKPKEFVAELFDSFAETFDDKLGSLGYKVPGLVGAAAKALRDGEEDMFGSALDAGCGTGLAGRYMRPLVSGALVGVDASQKMLDIASKCTTVSGCGQPKSDSKSDNGQVVSLYDGLVALDLEEMTLHNTLNAVTTSSERQIESKKFDLIVAADVLVYFGQLDSLIDTFAHISANTAGLIFSCERASEEEAPLGWRLMPSGRFAHTKRHAVAAAENAGYELVTYEEIIPRMERGEEVRGHLFSFVLAGSVKGQEMSNGEL